VTLVPVGSIAGPADLVKVQGKYAYVVADKTLTVVDVSNPRPDPDGRLHVPRENWGFRSSALWSTWRRFLRAGDRRRLEPGGTGAGRLDENSGAGQEVAVFGTKAVVADHMSGVDFIDVSNKAKPVSLGSFFLDGYARDVVAAGSLAYAVDAPTGSTFSICRSRVRWML